MDIIPVLCDYHLCGRIWIDHFRVLTSEAYPNYIPTSNIPILSTSLPASIVLYLKKDKAVKQSF